VGCPSTCRRFSFGLLEGQPAMDAELLKSLCNAIQRLQHLATRNWESQRFDPFDGCESIITDIRRRTKRLKLLWLIEKLGNEHYVIAEPPPNNKTKEFLVSLNGTEAPYREFMRCGDFWVEWISSQLIDTKGGETDAQSDTESDTAKKPQKKTRPMNTPATDCARLIREARRNGTFTSMQDVVDGYVSKNGGSAESIKRILNDNPEQWKNSG
jgi:hypothetical protein